MNKETREKREFYSNGNVKSIKTYETVEGKKHGLHLKFYRNGQLKREKEYMNGERVGSVRCGTITGN